MILARLSRSEITTAPTSQIGQFLWKLLLTPFTRQALTPSDVGPNFHGLKLKRHYESGNLGETKIRILRYRS